jgi:CRISPR-associated protein Cas1
MQLILNSRGTHLSKQNHLIEVRQASGEKQRFLPQDIDMIFISKGISFSSDVLIFSMQHSIDIVFINHSGEAQGRVWNNKFGSIATIRKQQMQFAQDSVGMEWVRKQVIQKIQNQIAFVYQAQYSQNSDEHHKLIDTLIRRIKRVLLQIQEAPLSISFEASLRGWEGTASRHYFKVLSMTLPEFYRFEKRSRRPAEDIFNCILNYLYGILYARVESALIKAGIDPFIGIWHADEYNKPVLTYDFIEPYRDWADRIAFRLCHQYAIRTADTQAYQQGFWLGLSGKKTVITAFNEYLEEIIKQKDRIRARSTHIQLDAHALAQEILKFNK